MRSLCSAFAREIAVRLPRLLTLVRAGDAGDAGEPALLRTDATMLAEGCALLGDAAGARALRRLHELLADDADAVERVDAAETAALLLGRWSAGSTAQT